MTTARIKTPASFLACATLLVFLVLQSYAFAGWTADDRRNVEHFFRSKAADSAAIQIINRGASYSIMSESDVKQIVKYLKIALRESKLVKDSVLDKAHPELKLRYHNQYQRGLAMQIQSLTQHDNLLGIAGSRLHDQYVDWFNAHNHQFRIPK